MHIGGNTFITAKNGFPVDIRQFWIPPNETELHPTRKGLVLTLPEWEDLVACMPTINNIPEVQNVNPCYLGNDHQNQMGMLTCLECSPNGLEPDMLD